jgi:hypothetical protein
MDNIWEQEFSYKLNINSRGQKFEYTLNLLKSNFNGITLLDKKKSLEYYNDNDVRDNINKNNEKILVVLNSYDTVFDMSVLNSVHVLFLINPKNIKNMSALNRINILHLSFCKDIIDINELSNVKKLRLTGCPNINNIDRLINVSDLKMGCGSNRDIGSLRQIKKLTIHEKIYGIQFMTNLEEFIVRVGVNTEGGSGHHKEILKKNNGELVHIHTLNLTGCHNIKDVSSLRNVNTLNISDCQGITDVSGLTKVHELNISHCPKIKDVGCLRKLKKLTINQKNKFYGIQFLVLLEELQIIYVHFLACDKKRLEEYNKKILKKYDSELNKLKKINNNFRIVECMIN